MYSKSLRLFDPGKTKVEQDSVSIKDLKDPLLDSKIGPEPATALREDIDLIEGVYDPLNIEAYRDGRWEQFPPQLRLALL